MKSLEKVGLRSLAKSFLIEPREDYLSLRALLRGESLRLGLGVKPGPVAVSLGPPRPGWKAVAPLISVLEGLPLGGGCFIEMSSSKRQLTASTLEFRVRPGKDNLVKVNY